MPKKKSKKWLIKKGTPHPGYPTFKLESPHLTDKEADKAETALLENPKVVATRRIAVPKQELVYAQRRRPRITPKRPKLRR